MERASTYTVTNVTRGAVLAEKSRKADNPISRAFGLMGKASLPPGGGLIIQPCSSVTCFFMRFPIDVIFVGRDNAIIHAVPAMRPWTVSRYVRGSKFVVELPAGTLERTGSAIGDVIEVRAV